MSHHKAHLFLPQPAELILKASRPNRLCCFDGLLIAARRSSADHTMYDITEEEANQPAVQVYRPQSMLFPNSCASTPSCSDQSASSVSPADKPPTIRRVNSADLTRETQLSAVLDPSWTTPNASARCQRLLPVSPRSRITLDTSSLHSLLGSLLRWRTSSPAILAAPAAPAAATQTPPLQESVSRAQDGSDGVNGDLIETVVAVNRPTVQEDFTIRSASSTADEVPEVENSNRNSNNSSIVELYLDSILEHLPADVESTVDGVGIDTVDMAARDVGEFDELARLAEADADATDPTELVELARGDVDFRIPDDSGQCADFEKASATSTPTVAALATPPASGVDSYDGCRRLSTTGSEPATDEFSFIRVRVLPVVQSPANRSTSIAAATTPRLRRAATIDAAPLAPPRFPSPPPTTKLPSDQPKVLSDADVGGKMRLRFHRRRQSYFLNSRQSEVEASNPVVLTGARHSLRSPPVRPGKQRQVSVVAMRAVIFHPPSQAARAAYLVNYLASNGQPASLWSSQTVGPTEIRAKRRHQLSKRLRDGLFGGSRRSRAATASQLADALEACASDRHLPVVLLPASTPEDDRFVSRLRESLASLASNAASPLPAGLVVVVSEPSEASHWAAAAGAETPTLVLRDDADGHGQSQKQRLLGPQCCRQVLDAAHRSAALLASTL